MAKLPINELVERGRAALERAWAETANARNWKSEIPTEIQEAAARCVNSRTKTYRYVFPTQILAKVVDNNLDSRSIQEGSGLEGAFDARSLCHKVVVPFDRANHNVLGGSPEPYVNNPLRIPALLPKFRAPQKDKSGFDDLCRVTQYLEEHPDAAPRLLDCVVASIRSRLDTVQIVYPVPNRASLEQTLTVIRSLLAERTGGIRLQVVSVALFEAIGERFQLYDHVDTAPINAADASTGSVADLACVDEDERVVLAVEVKDRELEIRHVQDKLPGVREQGVRELLFVVTSGVAESDAEAIHDLETVRKLSERGGQSPFCCVFCRKRGPYGQNGDSPRQFPDSFLVGREFVTGQNVYAVAFDKFLESCLILFGESGRRQFLVQVGEAIDKVRGDLVHRQAWRDLLQVL